MYVFVYLCMCVYTDAHVQATAFYTRESAKNVGPRKNPMRGGTNAANTVCRRKPRRTKVYAWRIGAHGCVHIAYARVYAIAQRLQTRVYASASQAPKRVCERFPRIFLWLADVAPML